MHELTHMWQGRNKLIRDIQILVAAKDRDYDYSLGSQWRDYGLEQQATIVGDWAAGRVEHGKSNVVNGVLRDVGPLSIGSPLFRYMHRNVRKNDNGAKSVRGTSVRALARPFPWPMTCFSPAYTRRHHRGGDEQTRPLSIGAKQGGGQRLF